MTVLDAAAAATPHRKKVVRTAADRIAEVSAAELKERMIGDQVDRKVQETRRVVLCLMRSEEIDIVIEHLQEKYADDPTFQVENAGTFWRIDCENGFEIDCDEIEPWIGHRYNVFDFMVNVTTTIGRAYNDGNKFVMTTELMGLEKELPSYVKEES